MNLLTSTFFRRMVLLLLPFTALVIYGYSELIVFSMRAAENRTVQEYLRAEYALFERRFAETPTMTLPSSDNLTAWWEGDEDLPAHIAALEPGVHALSYSRHLLVGEPGGAGRRAYFVLSEPALGSGQMIRSEMESTMYLAAIIVFLSGALLAVILARLLSRPVRALAEYIESPGQAETLPPGYDRNDEIGVLGRALGDLIDRMEAALGREKAVTRYASHDLRTPVSVIRIALSVLKLPDCDAETRQRNLQRIDAACAEIEERIEVHLCLAREGAELPEEQCNLRAMVEDELAKHSHTITARQIDVTIDGASPAIVGTRSMLRLVLGNLVQNAVNHAEQTIQVLVGSNEIVLRNPVQSEGSEPPGDGLGLEIVQRVCDRMAWILEVRSESGEFVARVQFDS